MNLVVAVVLVALAVSAAIGLLGWWIDASADQDDSSDEREETRL